MAKTKWQFYQWHPKDFWSDYRVNGVPGKSLAILRVLHDLLWMEQDKYLPDDQMMHKRLRITKEEWKAARDDLLKAGLILTSGGDLEAPHISEYWVECRRLAAIRKGNIADLNEERKARAAIIKARN